MDKRAALCFVVSMAIAGGRVVRHLQDSVTGGLRKNVVYLSPENLSIFLKSSSVGRGI